MEWIESRDPVKRWVARHKLWTGILLTVGALMVVGAISGTSDTTSTSGSSSNTYYDPGNEVAVPSDSSSYDSGSSYSSESSGQENAREQAANYLAYSAFSRKGLIQQLEYEGYSTADSTYAADAVGADWNEQAALKAKQYLEYSSFSRSGLQQQLE